MYFLSDYEQEHEKVCLDLVSFEKKRREDLCFLARKIIGLPRRVGYSRLLASRIESLNKTPGTTLLLSQATRTALRLPADLTTLPPHRQRRRRAHRRLHFGVTGWLLYATFPASPSQDQLCRLGTNSA